MMKAILKALLLLMAVAVVLAVGIFVWIGSRGISARKEPGPIETAVARTMRRLAIPRGDRNRSNPTVMTPEIVAEGMAHYADHCAGCHANDGSGETQIGLGLYPRPPDLRLPSTQSLTDGELFYIIENGVRLSGMPAWGTGTQESAEDTWHLVHFIRHLVRIPTADLERMKNLNPRSTDERFHTGDRTRPPSTPHRH
jgi:mono/diheme cytochrome c family protein